VGIVPFYVNPEEGINVSLSDRPELVKAVRYCIKKGATIVLHGITHQYKGISALDYEFWDGETDKPIANQTPQEISKKIEAGINECTKNSIYPLLWETPHYAASIAAYQTISKYFSTSIERRMVGEDEDDGQFFPFLIAKDIYGQKIFPENLGYLPTFQQRDSFELCINQMIETAKAIYNVRDGYASFYFHTHLSSTDYLRQIVEGISSLGFSFVDLRQETNWVKTKDKIILSGSQSYTMNLDHSFLSEIYYDQHGEIKKYIISNRNFTGNISKRINLKPDEIYIAEPLKNPISVVSDRNKNKINSLVNHRNAALN
jgi:uncharacterized protein YdaL